MSRHADLLIAPILAAALLAPLQEGRADVGGVAGRVTPFGGVLDLGNGDRCDISIQIERFGFFLSTMANKYRIVRILIDCERQTGLALSATDDRLETTIGTRTVPAILNLPRSDSAVWDGLDPEMQRSLTYPSQVKPREPVYVFGYLPADQVKTMPTNFIFTLAALGRSVTLTNRTTRA